MSTFKRAGDDVEAMARELIGLYHEPLRDYGVRIDFVFAYGERDEVTLQITSWALTKNGQRALGLTRKLALKDRAMGRGDAEISLDADWWEHAPDQEKRALLDHELTHLVPTTKTDDLRRPVLKLKPHDYEFGWFRSVAERHGVHSMECKQMATMVEESGQYLLPLGYLPPIVEPKTFAEAHDRRRSRMAALEVDR